MQIDSPETNNFDCNTRLLNIVVFVVSRAAKELLR